MTKTPAARASLPEKAKEQYANVIKDVGIVGHRQSPQPEGHDQSKIVENSVHAQDHELPQSRRSMNLWKHLSFC